MRYGYLAAISMAALGLTPVAFAAEEDAPRSKINVDLGGRQQNSSWNTSLRGNQQELNQEQGVEPGMSELTLTVYGGRGLHGKAFGPVRNRRGVALEMDVTAELESCEDGNTRVNALRIGTWRYKMDGSCDDFRRGGHITVSLNNGNTVITTQADHKKSQDDSAQIRCDHSTWTCRTE